MLYRTLSVGLVLFSVSMSAAADWPQFRGPGGLGIGAGTGLPIEWKSSAVVWQSPLPGAGSSSPIVVGERIFVTCFSGVGPAPAGKGKDKKGAAGGDDLAKLQRHLVCLDRDGKILWQRAVAAAGKDAPYSGFQALHGFASSTPASDGKRVFVFFGTAGVLAFDLEGKQLWQQSVGTGTNGWGSGTSVVLHKDLVIVNASVENKAIMALRAADGSVAWTAKGISQSWNTPALVTVDGPKELVVSVSGRLRAFDPDTGTELWNCDGLHDYVCPSVIAHDEVVYAIGARSNTAIAVRAGGKGDVSKTHELWRISKGSNVSSPVYHDGHLYWASESRGVAYCVNAKDGKVVYEERLPTTDRVYASPVVADGKIFYMSRTKGSFILAAAPAFKLLAHNEPLDASVFNGSPAVVDGRILVRSDSSLYCLGKK